MALSLLHPAPAALLGATSPWGFLIRRVLPGWSRDGRPQAAKLGSVPCVSPRAPGGASPWCGWARPRPAPGGDGSEAVAVNPDGARRQHLRAKCQPCLAWHPRQDLSLSLWKQAAQHVNPLGLGASAPLRLTVSLSPVPSQGWEVGDSGGCLGKASRAGWWDTQPKSSVWQVGLMAWRLGSGGRAGSGGGTRGPQVMACRAGEGMMLLRVSDSADRHPAASGLGERWSVPQGCPAAALVPGWP